MNSGEKEGWRQDGGSLERTEPEEVLQQPGFVTVSNLIEAKDCPKRQAEDAFRDTNTSSTVSADEESHKQNKIRQQLEESERLAVASSSSAKSKRWASSNSSSPNHEKKYGDDKKNDGDDVLKHLLKQQLQRKDEVDEDTAVKKEQMGNFRLRGVRKLPPESQLSPRNVVVGGESQREDKKMPAGTTQSVSGQGNRPKTKVDQQLSDLQDFVDGRKPRPTEPPPTMKGNNTNKKLLEEADEKLRTRVAVGAGTRAAIQGGTSQKVDLTRQFHQLQNFANNGGNGETGPDGGGLHSGEGSGGDGNGRNDRHQSSTVSFAGAGVVMGAGGRPEGVDTPVWEGGRRSRRRHKSEVGLQPGQPIPGAYEADWIVEPTWPRNDESRLQTAQVTRANQPQHQQSPSPGSPAEPNDQRSNSLPEHEGASIRSDVSQSNQSTPITSTTMTDRATQPRNVQAEASNDSNTSNTQDDEAYQQAERAPISIFEYTQRRKQWRWILVLSVSLLVLVVVAVAVVVLVILLQPQANDSDSECDKARNAVEPNVFLQCECFARVDRISQPTRDAYNDLRASMFSQLYSNETVSDISSCDHRNLALLSVAAQETRNETDSNRDRFLLTVVYLDMSGELWQRNSGWLTSESMCTWFGVTCHTGSMPSTVSRLELPNNKLRGSLVPELFSLSELRAFNFSEAGDTHLDGGLPTLLGRLTRLEMLHLNLLNTSIPSEIGNLILLEKFVFGSCGMNRTAVGTIPTEIGLLSSLRTFDLTLNGAVGEIPSQLGNATSLETLYLHSNSLVGNIPTELGRLTSLVELNLGSTNISGTIPTELNSANSSLRSLDLSSTRLNGTDLLSFALTFRNLEHLVGQNAGISGPIPPLLFRRLPFLRRLVVPQNEISGSLPTTIGEATNLSVLDVGNNNLTGTIPTEIGYATRLDVLDLRSNHFRDPVPDASIELLRRLDYLYLHDNDFNKSFDSGIGGICSLTLVEVTADCREKLKCVCCDKCY